MKQFAEQSRSSLTRSHPAAAELIARNTDAARTYYHYVSDALWGQPPIVDEDGIVLTIMTMTLWGNLTAQEEAVPNRFKFTGQQRFVTQQHTCRRGSTIRSSPALLLREDTFTVAMG